MDFSDPESKQIVEAMVLVDWWPERDRYRSVRIIRKVVNRSEVARRYASKVLGTHPRLGAVKLPWDMPGEFERREAAYARGRRTTST